MTHARKRNSRKSLIAIILVALVACLMIGGTLAYLTQTANTVTNTFVAASGLIDEDPGDNITPPVVPDPDDPSETITLDAGFNLVEHEAVMGADDEYTLTSNLVMANSYDKVVAGENVPKDPYVYANIEDGVNAYVFLVVTDTSEGLLEYTIDSDWVALEDYDGVYVYKNMVISGDSTIEINTSNILANKTVKISEEMIVEDENTSIGSLSFAAYACQADGFDSAADAWAACFGN